MSLLPHPRAATPAWITRKLRELEKDPDPGKLRVFLARCDEEGADLSPWAKRLEALRRRVLVQEVMES